MIKVQDDWNVAAELMSILDDTACHIAQQVDVGIVPGAAADLENDRALRGDTGLDNCLHLLHVVEVVGRNGITALDGLCEHISCVHKTKFLVADHRMNPPEILFLWPIVALSTAAVNQGLWMPC